MTKRRSVRVVVAVKIKGVKYALLQQRGRLDPSQLPRKFLQSWPGVYHVSARGTLKPGEELHDGVNRVMAEQLGERMAHTCNICALRSFREVARAERPAESVVTYAVELPWQLITSIPRGFSGLLLVNAKEAKEICGAECITDGKQFGTRYHGESVWMFQEEEEAVRKVLGVELP